MSTPEDKAADAVEEETTATEVGDYEAEADVEAEADDTEAVAPAEPELGSRWARVLAFGVLPVLALLLGGAAGYLRYDYSSRHDADAAGTESVQAARDSTIALLSYKPESVDKDLTAARDRLTGSFLDAYTQLVNTVVIPGAKEKKISAVAQVPAAASVSAKPDHAVVLAFVDQTVVVGNDAPTRTASSVRITLEKVGGRWLISGFEPV